MQKKHHQFEQTPQPMDFMSSPLIPYELNTNQIMQTIWSTEQLIKRTKIYVQNIPIKTNFYQPTISESRRSNEDYINREKYYQVGRLKLVSPQRQQPQRLSNNANFLSLSYESSQKFQKSPTPVEKLADFQFQIDYSNINTDSKSQQKFLYEQESRLPFSKPKPLSFIEETEQNSHYVNHPDSHTIQTFRPVGWTSPKNASKPIVLKSPKNLSMIEAQKYHPADRVSTGAKTPLSKTFEAYSAYTSQPFSTNSKRATNTEVKQNETNLQQTQLNNEQGMRYFRKQVEANASPNVGKSQYIKQRRQQRTRAISSILNSNRHFSDHSLNQEGKNLQNIGTLQSELVWPSRNSPKANSPSPSRQYYDEKIQTEGVVHYRSINVMTEPKQANSSNKDRRIEQRSAEKTPGKWIKKNTPVNPFQSIQQEYEQRHRARPQKSPSNLTKTYSKNTKNPFSPKYSVQKNQLPDKRETIHKTTQNYFSAKRDSPDTKEYQSIQIKMRNSFGQSSTQNIKIEQGKTQITRSGRKKPGITVLLNSSSPKNSTKIQQAQYDTSINPFEMTVSHEANAAKNQNHSIQISIQNKPSQQSNQKNIKYIETPLKQRDYQQRVNVSITPANKNSDQQSLTERFNMQLNRLEVLNHVDNQIYLRESTKSKERSPKKQHKLKTDSSKKYKKDEEQYQEKQSFSKNVPHEQTPLEVDFRRYPVQPINRQRLKINEINNLTIQPSSLEKYKSSNNFSPEKLSNFQDIDVINNTFSFTPQKNKQDINVPKSHIIRLENSMNNLMNSSQEKSISSKRKKIFDSRQKSNKKYKIPQNLFINPLRAKDLYQKEFQSHNKTLEAKLYNFLVEEDVQGKRPTQKKKKVSPSRRKQSSSKGKWGKIFDNYGNSVQKSQRNSPRIQTVKALFKYTPAKESQKIDLLDSVQNFEESIRKDSLDKQSIGSYSNSKQKPPISGQKLDEAQIRRQIKRIKEYEFVQKYMTNFELEKLMRGYIHKHIPARKWSLLVIDEVYKRIRCQKEKSRLNSMLS